MMAGEAPRPGAAATTDDAEVRSPCISVCALDPTTGWCTGCLRSIDEIAVWGTLDAASRRAVLARLPARSLALKEGSRGRR